VSVTARSVTPNAGSGRLDPSRHRNPLTGIFHPGLPFYLIPMMPLFWLLGLGQFTFAIAGGAACIGLLLMHPIRVPRGFGPWLLFMGWMLASALMLEPTANRYLSFLIRAVIYIGATGLFLYVYNLPAKYLPTGKVLAAFGGLFIFIAVIGGYLGLFLGEARLNTPLSQLMPPALLENSFVNSMVRPPFAQEQNFLGFAINRPAMPFAFTNQWGSALVPMTFMAVAAVGRMKRFRRFVPIIALLALVPMAISANRGLWISLVASVFYVAIRRASNGQLVLAIRLVVVLIFAAGLVLVSPLGEIVGGRATSTHSIDARSDIYSDVLERVPESPLLGFGAPEANPDPFRPAIGTHGMFWTALFSHGIPGAALYVVFWVGMAVRTGRGIKNQEHLLLHVAVASSLPTMMFYDHNPAALPTMMICAALILRDSRTNATREQHLQPQVEQVRRPQMSMS